MSFWSDPFKSVSDTVQHVSDVVSNDPTAKAVATIGAIAGAAYLTGGLSLAGTAATAETGAAVTAASAGVEGSAIAASMGGIGVAAPSATAATGASLWSTVSGIGSSALAGLDTAGKVAGAVSLINRATGGSAAVPMPAGGYPYGTVYSAAQVPTQNAITGTAAAAGGYGGGTVAVAAKSGMDTPTMLALLASVATIALFFRK